MGQVRLSPGLLHLGQEVIQDHQPPGPGIVKLVSQFPGAQERVQRHHHRAQAQGGMVSYHELRTIREQDGQALPWGQALVFESPG